MIPVAAVPGERCWCRIGSRFPVGQGFTIHVDEYQCMPETGSQRETEPDGDSEQLVLGEIVFNAAGDALGKVRGFDSDGFVVTMLEGYEPRSAEHTHTATGVGEAELLWRCTECGELGRIEEGVPEACPDCGGAKESLMYWIED